MSGVETLNRTNEILKLPYLVLIVSLLGTLGATYFFYQNSQLKDKTRFIAEVTKSKAIIETKISTRVMMLKSLRACIEADPAIDKEKFAIFARNLEIEDSPGTVELGYIEFVSPDKRQKLVDSVKLSGADSFKIFPERPDNVKEDAYIVRYLEPFVKKNQTVLGYDMGSDAVLLTAINEARDSGKLSASGKVALSDSGEIETPSGFLMFLPIYTGKDIPQNVGDRKRLLKGFVYSPFQTGEFLSDVQKTIASNYLAISIFDGEELKENFLAGAETKDSVYSATNEINVANRKWIIKYNSLPDFEAQSSTNLTTLIFICGLVFGLLLFGMTYLESYARANSEKIAANLKKSENEKALLLDSEQKARENAENANHAKDEFIANVSHELRTPLNSIAGWSRILQSEDVSPAIKQQALQTIDRNLRTQTRIIEDLLDFSKLTSGDKNINTQPIRFSDVFEEAFQEVLFAAEQKGLAIEKYNFLNGQEVYGDYPSLKKVVKNLLSNAIKFTDKGGRIVAEAKEVQEMLKLKISDNGQGIPKSFLPHIFEHFKQGDSSITKQHGGLGMGLAISRQIIESYGGKIEAESEGRGKGTLFVVTLPFLHQ